MENIIVIGGGLMGSSAAWQLSQYGEKVLLIEQQDSNYQSGSSYGNSRITRSLGPKHDIFSFLQRKTIEETKNLLGFLNGIKSTREHKMSDIYTTSPVTYIFKDQQQEQIASFRYKGQKDNYKKGAGDAAFRKFGLTVPDNYIVIKEFKKYSGTFNPHELIKKMQLGIKKHGNTIRYNTKAINIKKLGTHYELRIKDTKKGTTKVIQTRKVIIATGAYLVPLMKKMAPYFKKLIRPKRIALSFFRINKKRYDSYSKWQKKLILKAHPVFDQNGKMFFSMLDKIDKKGYPIFKAGGHHAQGNISDLDAIWRQRPEKKERKWTKKKFTNYIKSLEIPLRKKDIELVNDCMCVYSNSATKIPYVTNIITKDKRIDKDIVVIGGMSGTGAKGCLTYGLLAADLLLNINDTSKMYQRAKRAMGTERLYKEVVKLRF